MKTYIFLILALISIQFTNAQSSFVEKCIGTWEGTMIAMKDGKETYSVPVVLTIEKTEQSDTWTWKTEFISKTHPVTKDYKLILKDETRNLYVFDENNGIELNSYLFGEKLYSVFETSGLLLTSSYELVNDKLIFEVTSGKKLESINADVSNFSVDYVQKVIFEKSK
ncbi:hypothetical protein [Aureivirga marina]|uniref:hypothetical protein n=1 Tax=Aureivirga marina TaxID=1182451 RepID=UPI0018C9A97A|nr:hypothetical protein [Aureivirga marina]